MTDDSIDSSRDDSTDPSNDNSTDSSTDETDATDATDATTANDHGTLSAFFESYREAYTALDLEAVLEHYTVPLLSVTADDCYWLTGESDVESVIGAYLEMLRDRGYDRGEIDELAVHRLAGNTALVSSAWTRYTTDDEVLERLGATYLCRRTADGWRILALVLHDHETLISEPPNN